jgi:proline iminopeptidase
MDPKYMAGMAKKLPHGQFLLCPKGSHMAMYDDQQVYFDGLIGFLRGVEAK